MKIAVYKRLFQWKMHSIHHRDKENNKKRIFERCASDKTIEFAVFQEISE